MDNPICPKTYEEGCTKEYCKSFSEGRGCTFIDICRIHSKLSHESIKKVKIGDVDVEDS